MTGKTACAFALAMACATPLALAPATARAQNVTPYAPSGVLSLNTQASAEVPQDVLDISLLYEQEASDPSALTSALNQRADTALQRAKGVRDVTVRTGAFSIIPSTDRNGHISGWHGRTGVVLESHDFAAASKLAGEMASIMPVGNVQFSLSPQAQNAVEQRLTSEAIATFRQQASSSAKAFGYSNYSIREVNIEHNEVMPRPMMMISARALSADGTVGQPLPLEGGTSTVSVNVSGSVQMK